MRIVRYFFLLLTVFSFTALLGQTFISEDFSGGFPPNGWSFDGHSENWGLSSTDNCGANEPEAKLHWDPEFDGTTRFISPTMNTSGLNQVGVDFRHFVNHWSGSFTIGVASRSGGGSWDVVWDKTVTNDISAELILFDVSDNVGASDFQLCWFFTGNTDNLQSWFLDNINVYGKFQHDIRVENLIAPNVMAAGQSFEPETTVRNIGTDAEYFNVECKIYENGGLVYNQSQFVAGMNPGDALDVTFPSFSPATTDANYLVEVTSVLSGDQNGDNDQMTAAFSTFVRQRIVLWEEFTNTSCGPCASANPSIEAMLQNNGPSVVLAIWYHVWWPGNGDPMYQANIAENTARTQYYGVSAVPDSYCDGILEPSPGNTSQMQNAVDERYNTFTVVELEAQYDDNYKLRVDWNVVNELPTKGNYKLHVAVIENNIHYANPPGNNGETDFNYVMRKMYPDASGTTVPLFNGAAGWTYFDVLIDPSWAEENVQIIAFMQDDDTGEVLQTTLATYNSVVPVELTSFTANKNGDLVSLNWKTSSETNNAKFEIERAVNNSSEESEKSFRWETIGSIDGNGSTTSEHSYQFSDNVSNLQYETLSYRLKQIDLDGSFGYSEVVNIDNVLPMQFALDQNYPNPFNPVTTISYKIPEETHVVLDIYDILGNKVSTLVNENQNAGKYKLSFNATEFASGIYIYQLRAGSFKDAKKMTILK